MLEAATKFPWTTLLQLVGLALASFGLLRESFADLAKERPYGEGRFGEGEFGGAPSSGLTAGLIAVATTIRLLPKDEALTDTDRKQNAASAVAGVIVLFVATSVELFRGFMAL